MRLLPLAAIALLVASSPSRLAAAQASPSTPIPSRDEKFGIRSTVLGEDREIWVHLPTGAATGERFDVVYVLDGHALFPATSGEVDYRVAMRVPPRVVVVGVTSRSSQGRGRDFTHVVDTTRKDVFPETGKADQFIRFLETEVIPAVAQRYPVTSHRMLIGHSLAGLFAVYTFAARPDLFESYITISPTLPWEHESILPVVTSKLGSTPGGRALYISVGNEEHGYQRAIERMEALLRRSAPRDLRWKVERYPQYDHTQVVPASVHAGLTFILDNGR